MSQTGNCFQTKFKGNINEKGLSELENKTCFSLCLSRQEKILKLINGFQIVVTVPFSGCVYVCI